MSNIVVICNTSKSKTPRLSHNDKIYFVYKNGGVVALFTVSRAVNDEFIKEMREVILRCIISGRDEYNRLINTNRVLSSPQYRCVVRVTYKPNEDNLQRTTH